MSEIFLVEKAQTCGVRRCLSCGVCVCFFIHFVSPLTLNHRLDAPAKGARDGREGGAAAVPAVAAALGCDRRHRGRAVAVAIAAGGFLVFWG